MLVGVVLAIMAVVVMVADGFGGRRGDCIVVVVLGKSEACAFGAGAGESKIIVAM